MQNLCGMTKEEVTNLISTMQKICDSNNCIDCPFGNDEGYCRLENTHPCSWGILSDKEIWRAVF